MKFNMLYKLILPLLCIAQIAYGDLINSFKELCDNMLVKVVDPKKVPDSAYFQGIFKKIGFDDVSAKGGLIHLSKKLLLGTKLDDENIGKLKNDKGYDIVVLAAYLANKYANKDKENHINLQSYNGSITDP